MPSSTETFLCDRFTTEKQGWWGWTTKKHGCPTPLTPTCASHINSIPKLKHMLPCEGSRSEFLTYPLMIRFTLLFSSLPVTLPPYPPGGHGEDWQRGRGLKWGKTVSKREAEHFFTTESWVPLHWADASSYFLAALTSGLLFPLIRLHCSQ